MAGDDDKAPLKDDEDLEFRARRNIHDVKENQQILPAGLENRTLPEGSYLKY